MQKLGVFISRIRLLIYAPPAFAGTRVLAAVHLAACAFLAACSSVPTPSADAPTRLEPGPNSYALSCPPGSQTERRVGGVCVASFLPDQRLLENPALALAPRDGIVAVAGSGAPLARVFVTTNGGGDWLSAGLPSELAPVARSGETLSTSRVALEFDGDARLHLVGELRYGTDSGSGVPTDLYYTSSSDLGRTWVRPVILPANRWGVFPKLTARSDRLFVTWGYRGDYGLNLAFSNDAGRTWLLAKKPPTDCINSSEVALLGATPYVACASYMRNGDTEAALGRNPFTGLRLYRLDPSNELTLVASLESFKGVWPRLFATADGRLVLAAKLYRVHSPPTKGWDKCCAAVARSEDDGRSWSDPADLRRALRSEDDWDTFELNDARLDAWGILHFIASGSDQTDPANGSPGIDARLVHASFDPASGRLLGESSLTPATHGPQGYYPGKASLAFDRTLGMALWTYGNGLEYTRVELKRAR